MTHRKPLRRRTLVVEFGVDSWTGTMLWARPKGMKVCPLDICEKVSQLILGRALEFGERFTCTLSPPRFVPARRRKK